METYSLELAASLEDDFDLDCRVLPGRPDGHPPHLWSLACFLLKTMLFCLARGRHYQGVVFGDLVLFPAALCHWLVAPRRRRLVVVYGLDLVFHRRLGLLSALYRPFFSAFRTFQGIFAGIVAISRYTGRLAEDAGLRNVIVINPSLPRGGLVDVAPDDRNLPDAWRDAKRRILYFGRLVPRKGALWYAENVLPRLGDDARFFVVGQSSDRRFVGRIERSGNTHCLGRVDAPCLAAMIRSADLVVMPNIAVPEAVDVEGFGLAAIEASAIGGRLLASCIDGISDAVIDGVTGSLVPPADPQAWTQATLGALAVSDEEASRARCRAATATRERYSRQAQADGFIQLLQPVGEVA